MTEQKYNHLSYSDCISIGTGMEICRMRRNNFFKNANFVRNKYSKLNGIFSEIALYFNETLIDGSVLDLVF